MDGTIGFMFHHIQVKWVKPTNLVPKSVFIMHTTTYIVLLQKNTDYYWNDKVNIFEAFIIHYIFYELDKKPDSTRFGPY